MPKSHNTYSSNGQQYAQLDFTQVNEKGLKPLIDALTKQGLTVENVASSNRTAVNNGVGTKTATLRFQDQQELKLTVNDTGDLVGFKLNGKTIPVQQADSIVKVATSLAAAVKQNSKKFTDGLAKKAARVIDTSDTKTAVKSNVQRLKEARNRRDALQTAVTTLSTDTAAAQKQSDSVKQQIQAEQTRYNAALH